MAWCTRSRWTGSQVECDVLVSPRGFHDGTDPSSYDLNACGIVQQSTEPFLIPARHGREHLKHRDVGLARSGSVEATSSGMTDKLERPGHGISAMFGAEPWDDSQRPRVSSRVGRTSFSLKTTVGRPALRRIDGAGARFVLGRPVQKTVKVKTTSRA
jgi:hypothetical protein